MSVSVTYKRVATVATVAYTVAVNEMGVAVVKGSAKDEAATKEAAMDAVKVVEHTLAALGMSCDDYTVTEVSG